MSLFRKNKIQYASYSLPSKKQIKKSLSTKNKQQAQKLHNKQKAKLQQVKKLKNLPNVTFKKACLKQLKKKANKKSLNSNKSQIKFQLKHFKSIKLKNISKAKIYSAVSKMHNKKTKKI